MKFSKHIPDRNPPRSIVLAIAACIGSFVCLPTHAEAMNVPTAVVRYADLDISQAAGIETLYRRIEHAAAEVCSDSGFIDLRRSVETEKCKRAAFDDAVAQIEWPAGTGQRGDADIHTRDAVAPPRTQRQQM